MELEEVFVSIGPLSERMFRTLLAEERREWLELEVIGPVKVYA